MAAPSIASDTVESLVARLRDLRCGLATLPDVIALGEVAIPALELLLRSRSESIPHRRWLAADALAAIGGPAATAALVRALRDCSSRELEPTLLEAESLIVNRIAQHLDRHPAVEATEALLDALRRYPYSSCARALGERGDPRAIPILVACLYEDTARLAAMDALRRFKQAAAELLIRALSESSVGATTEPPTRVDGRAAAASLLGALNGVDVERSLRTALTDTQPRVRLAAALALSGHRGLAARQAAWVLVTALGTEDWTQTKTIVEALVRLGTYAERPVLAAIAQEPRTRVDRVRRLLAAGVAARLNVGNAEAILTQARDASDPNLRLAAVGVLVQQSSAAGLKPFLFDPVALIRRRAMEALCARDELRPEEAVMMLGDADAPIRKLAERRLHAHGPVALTILRRTIIGWGTPLRGSARLRLWQRALRLWLMLLLFTSARAPTDRPART